MELGVERFCVGCKRKEACPNDKDACVSQHLFVWAVGWADDPTVIERIEGRLMRPGIVDCNGGG
jgi:hypothetical protein